MIETNELPEDMPEELADKIRENVKKNLNTYVMVKNGEYKIVEKEDWN